jgi:tRNA threonylcarbamoyl adenosine modification protein (Sua5/YciO/YrdC/YwlC family)
MAQFFEIHPIDPQPRLIRQAAGILRDGGVIAYPTDSSYALGCHLGDAEAAKRIRRIRGVGDDHHLTLVLRDLTQIGHFARLDNWQFRIVRQGTPGRFTFVLPATREVPRRLQHPRRSTVGVRVPGHPGVRALLDELGSRSVPTLILPGAEPLNDAGVTMTCWEVLDLVIDAGLSGGRRSSAAPVIVRQGAGDPTRLASGPSNP